MAALRVTAQPHLIQGGLHRDARGELAHVNGFDFAGIERFYAIRPAQTGIVRGWVGHRVETKCFSVVRGAVLVGVVRPDDWTSPDRGLEVMPYQMRADEPSVLKVPGGFFTGSMALEPGSILLVFSTGAIGEAMRDDYRLPEDYWPLSVQGKG